MFLRNNFPMKLWEKNIFSKICRSQSDVTIIVEPRPYLAATQPTWMGVALPGTLIS